MVKLGDLPPHHLDLVVDGETGLDAVRPHGHIVHVHGGPAVQPAGPDAGPIGTWQVPILFDRVLGCAGGGVIAHIAKFNGSAITI